MKNIDQWKKAAEKEVKGKKMEPIALDTVDAALKVLNEGKTRRPLTIWIIRPEENGVSGEDYFLIDDDGKMVEQ